MNGRHLSIIFVTNNYLPYQGGVVSSIKTHTNELRKLGHKVTVITLDFQKNLPQEPDTIRLWCPIRFIYKNNPMAIPFFARQAIKKIVEQLNPDLVHTHHPFLLGTLALQTTKKLDIPIIFTFHTLYHHYLHYIPLPIWLTKPVMHRLVRFFCSQVDGIIAPSKSTHGYLQQYNLSTPIHIIPSPISSIFFTTPLSHPKPTKKFQLLSVSRFTKEKNMPFLIDVITLLKHTHCNLKLVGYGAEYEFLKHYAYEHKKLTLDQLQFIEKPNKQELVNLYAQADLFLFASTSETQGLVMLEAMAQKTPVIAVKGPGQNDVIIDAFNGFLVANQKEMVEKINHLMHNKDLYTTLQHNALTTAQRYQAPVLIEELLNFYRRFLKNR